MQNAQALPMSSLTSPETPPNSTANPTASGQRFGRTALLIHALAWLAFGIAWALMGLLGEYTPESQAVQGVGMTISNHAGSHRIAMVFRQL